MIGGCTFFELTTCSNLWLTKIGCTVKLILKLRPFICFQPHLLMKEMLYMKCGVLKTPHFIYNISFIRHLWQAVTAKSPSSFESWSNRLLILASYKSSMVRLEKEWANLVKRWLSLVWEASVLASEFSISC